MPVAPAAVSERRHAERPLSHAWRQIDGRAQINMSRE
jgi:hypothetical protein